MNTLQINNYISNFKYGSIKEKFLGVFPRDCLPSAVTKLPATLIANTDSNDKPGEHWVAIYIDERSKGRYFDSYGLPPLHDDFVDFLDANCSVWKYNRDMIQGVTSTSCGKFCVLYVSLRCMGWHHNKILSIFNKNDLNANDKLVSEYVSSLVQ